MSDAYRAALERAYTLALDFHGLRAQRRPAATASFDALRAALNGPTPTDGMAPAEVIEQLAEGVEAGLMGGAGPRYFAKVTGGSHPVGVAADWLTSIWGQNSGSYLGSPANAVVEQIAAAWLLDLLSLPPECSIGFTTGATMASFVCLAAARSEVLRKVGWDVDAQGLFGAPPIDVCLGNDAHATIFAALRYLGLGHDRVIRIPTDDTGRMQAGALSTALASCGGPLIVIGQAGQINTGAFDPFNEIADLVHCHGGWLHVDGAFGLWARSCPALLHLTEGIEQADSWATDGHKWLQMPYDCGYAIVRDAHAHRRAMAYEASYLPAAGGECREPFHYVPELSRRARGFATWALIRALGRSGIAAMIEQHCALARRMAQRLASEAGVEIGNPVELNQFVVQFGTGLPPPQRDQLTRAVIGHVQAAGVCYVGEASWRERVVMRFSVISWATTEADIDRSAESIIAAWRAVGAGVTAASEITPGSTA
ncbi:pyridoxal phosphate-dependent decarboxylase family protein [Cupriavidus basilensis]|uniref:Aromatic-L-amino-acid decarboxylase n=1 Tax=Cupriavidus basilensis TaxID=68895 RepID=A0A0C4YB73_9BURK|nr:pyridoxal-dependent decarboxylase [Cupriavidus basilensis]AJG22807.1 Aromatic-L-amino-acid decarboxylase [Cupriavidus basilensis]